MKEEAQSLGHIDSNDKLATPCQVKPIPRTVIARETRGILNDNQDSKKSLAKVLESLGLSRESITRLLHLEDKG